MFRYRARSWLWSPRITFLWLSLQLTKYRMDLSWFFCGRWFFLVVLCFSLLPHLLFSIYLCCQTPVSSPLRCQIVPSRMAIISAPLAVVFSSLTSRYAHVQNIQRLSVLNSPELLPPPRCRQTKLCLPVSAAVSSRTLSCNKVFCTWFPISTKTTVS